jgi:hypothetical protein
MRPARLLTKDGGAADRGERRKAAGAVAQDLIAILAGNWITDAALSGIAIETFAQCREPKRQ